MRSGLDLRVLSHLHALSEIGKVFVFAFQGSPEKRSKFNDLFVSSDRSILSTFTNSELLRASSLSNKRPFAHRASHDSIREFQALVRTIKPDNIIFSRLETTEYFFSLEEEEKNRSTLDLDESINTFRISIEHLSNLEFPLINRLLLQQQLEYERSILEMFPSVWLSSKDEIARLNFEFPNNNYFYVPNVLVGSEFKAKIRSKEAIKLSFTGNFNYLPNQYGLRFLLDNVMTEVESHSLTVLGSGLESWRDYANVRFINNPELMVTHLQELDISLIPIFLGAGTRFKALEAMSVGLPLVSTRKGIEGLELEPYKDYLPAEKPSDFVQRIWELERDPHLFAELSINGMRKINRDHSLSSLIKIFRSMPHMLY